MSKDKRSYCRYCGCERNFPKGLCEGCAMVPRPALKRNKQVCVSNCNKCTAKLAEVSETCVTCMGCGTVLKFFKENEK
jgi:hypothetical protein